MSHGVIGAWFLDAAGEYNFEWGRTPMDYFHGCYVTAIADPDSVRMNRRIRQGRAIDASDAEPAVVEGPAYSVALKLRLVSVTFRIPSPELRSWRESLKEACRQSIQQHGAFLGDGATYTYTYTYAYRYTYAYTYICIYVFGVRFKLQH